jgi:hypothetical protein
MDPNETIKQLMAELTLPDNPRCTHPRGCDRRMVVAHLTALSDWIEGGGFLPTVDEISDIVFEDETLHIYEVGMA